MSHKPIKWLYEQLPDLVVQGVLTEETAEQLRRHYGKSDGTTGKRWAVVLFGILGGVLIGGGVILLLAHNWDELTRPLRAVLSFLPLLSAQALALFVITRKSQSTAWREAVGAYWTLTLGASIGLVAQTYNISGNFAGFMLTWVLLTLPCVYLLQASLAAALYSVGVTIWAVDVSDMNGRPMWFWALASLIMPFFLLRLRRDRHHPGIALVGWTLSICVCIATGFMPGRESKHTWVDAYALVLPMLYVGGLLAFDSERSLWKRPFQIVGGKGLVIFLLVLTFEDSWRHWYDATGWLALGLWIGLPLAAIVLSALCLRRAKPWHVCVACAPAVVMLGKILRQELGATAAMTLFNVYLAAIGTVTMIAGLRTPRLGTVNVGLGVLAILIIARFFDSNLSFVVRGVAFIVVGSGFLATNLLLTRHKWVTR
jgi:hypothetical protein